MQVTDPPADRGHCPSVRMNEEEASLLLLRPGQPNHTSIVMPPRPSPRVLSSQIYPIPLGMTEKSLEEKKSHKEGKPSRSRKKKSSPSKKKKEKRHSNAKESSKMTATKIKGDLKRPPDDRECTETSCTLSEAEEAMALQRFLQSRLSLEPRCSDVVEGHNTNGTPSNTKNSDRPKKSKSKKRRDVKVVESKDRRDAMQGGDSPKTPPEQPIQPHRQDSDRHDWTRRPDLPHDGESERELVFSATASYCTDNAEERQRSSLSEMHVHDGSCTASERTTTTRPHRTDDAYQVDNVSLGSLGTIYALKDQQLDVAEFERRYPGASLYYCTTVEQQPRPHQPQQYNNSSTSRHSSVTSRCWDHTPTPMTTSLMPAVEATPIAMATPMPSSTHVYAPEGSGISTHRLSDSRFEYYQEDTRPIPLGAVGNSAVQQPSLFTTTDREASEYALIESMQAFDARSSVTNRHRRRSLWNMFRRSGTTR